MMTDNEFLSQYKKFTREWVAKGKAMPDMTKRQNFHGASGFVRSEYELTSMGDKLVKHARDAR